MTRKARLQSLIQDRGITAVDEAAFAELQAALAPIGDRALRKLLRDTGLPLAPTVEGVRQENFAELERTLIALQAECESAVAAGDRVRARQCRNLVITAKDHARLAARTARDEQRAKPKEDMASWMLVWLENPALFSQWVRLWRQAHPDPDLNP